MFSLFFGFLCVAMLSVLTLCVVMLSMLTWVMFAYVVPYIFPDGTTVILTLSTVSEHPVLIQDVLGRWGGGGG